MQAASDAFRCYANEDRLPQWFDGSRFTPRLHLRPCVLSASSTASTGLFFSQLDPLQSMQSGLAKHRCHTCCHRFLQDVAPLGPFRVPRHSPTPSVLTAIARELPRWACDLWPTTSPRGQLRRDGGRLIAASRLEESVDSKRTWNRAQGFILGFSPTVPCFWMAGIEP